MAEKKVFETNIPPHPGTLTFKQLSMWTSDGGHSLTVEFNDDDDEGMFVRLKSWSGNKKHPDLERFLGKRVRVTVEVID